MTEATARRLWRLRGLFALVRLGALGDWLVYDVCKAPFPWGRDG